MLANPHIFEGTPYLYIEDQAVPNFPIRQEC